MPECIRCERDSETVVEEGGRCLVCRDWIDERTTRAGLCDCDAPDIVRTMAKGTPAEREYCGCGGLVTDYDYPTDKPDQ